MNQAVRRAIAVVIASAVALAACSADANNGSPGATSATDSTAAVLDQPLAPVITQPADFEGHGSVEQAYVVGAAPNTTMILADAASRIVGTGTTDAEGSLVLRDIEPGPGYTFRSPASAGASGTAEFTVLALEDVPDQSFYDDQQLDAGYNYLTMRDGIEVAATVRLPQGKTLADGPFPTVIEYSGYAVAPPHDALAGLLDPEAAANDPLIPSTSTAVGGIIAPLLGYATVSLQMRGSGCSGGAFGLFDLPTTADGYDAVEIVAAEPWVKGGKVGMVGISFSGISQFFVAGAQPPHLAAIAPMSVTDDLYSTGYPGGIFNDGFAASWIAERASDAEPAPEGGQPWAKAMIDDGDEQCLENQQLRLQTLDVDEILETTPHRDPALFDDRSPRSWAEHIEVPTFLVGALQDEQTGGQWPALIPALEGNDDVWVTILNGTHIDSLGPATISRWVEFLDLFVADQVPEPRAVMTTLGGTLYEQVAGAAAQRIPDVRFTDVGDVDAARAEFRKDPRVRVLFDNGGDPAAPGSLGPLWEQSFTSWPPPAAEATTFYLGADGALTASEPATQSTVTFRPDPDARPRKTLPEGDPWKALPPYVWAPVTGETGLGFVSDPLSSDLTVVGPASLDLQLASTAPDTDIQVAITEVRPDGQELYVQSGFLRASDRALDADRSTETNPVPRYREDVAEPLPSGQATEVRVPLLPISYAFRAGSKIRVTVTAPGGDRPEWTFATPATNGEVTNTVTLGGATPSRLVLPVLTGVVPGDAQPPCPSLRGQPCRAYEPAGNGG
jgi:predicted acyl esterase